MTQNDRSFSACYALKDILKTSLGPKGRDKLLLDEFGDVVVTNDGATILKHLQVKHPAARILVELALNQDAKVGDGTTTSVIFATELLHSCETLIALKIHPSIIIEGFFAASKMAIQLLKNELSIDLSSKSNDERENLFLKVANTSLNSKFTSQSKSKDKISKLAMNSVLNIYKFQLSQNKEQKELVMDTMNSIDIDRILFFSINGRNLNESKLVNGIILSKVEIFETFESIKNPRICLLDFNFRNEDSNIKVELKYPSDRNSMMEVHLESLKNQIHLMKEIGMNVIITTGNIPNPIINLLLDSNIIVFQKLSKEDLNRISLVTGGTIMNHIEDITSNDSSILLGDCEVIERIQECGIIYLFIGFKSISKPSSICTVVLYGPSSQIIEEAQRTIHDAQCVVARTIESNKIVPGGGAIEMNLILKLELYSSTFNDIFQPIILEYSKALQSILYHLANTSNFQSLKLLSELRRIHSKEDQISKLYGMNLFTGNIENMIDNGIIEPLQIKKNILLFGTECAATIIRINQFLYQGEFNFK